jgi:hypothetical protein
MFIHNNLSPMNPFRYLIAALLILTLTSCLKVPDENKFIGDAMILCKTDHLQKVVYGLSIYAYTNSSFQSVQVTSSAGPTKLYTLKSDQGSKTNFIYDMPQSEYSTTKPEAATYTFTATLNNGTTQIFTDELTNKVLTVPVLNKCTYNTQLLQLDVAWAATEGASSYAINVLNETTPVFWSNELSASARAFSVISGTNGWATGYIPEYGKTYTLRLFSYMYEDQGNSSNIQSVSYTDKVFVWGK